MADPIVPNFKPGVGRLTTDRFDFQKHINGEDFHHEAGVIVLNPAISVNGGPATTNLQSVIAQLNALVPQVIPDATGSVKGLIKLSGDLAGSGSSASAPKVSGLQGFPISTATPSNGDLLTYDSSLPGWKPAALNTTFTTLNVTGGYSLNSTGTALISATGLLTISPSSLTIGTPNAINITSSDGNMSITANGSGILQISAASTLSLNAGSGGVAINSGDFSAFGNLSLGGSSSNTMTVPAQGIFNNILKFVGSSARILFNGIIVGNGNQTINIRQNKFVVFPTSLTGTHTYTLSTTSTVDGDWFQLYNPSLFTQNLAGATSGAIAHGDTMTFLRISGVWTQVGA